MDRTDLSRNLGEGWRRMLVTCCSCGWERRLYVAILSHSLPLIRCPKCGSRNLEV